VVSNCRLHYRWTMKRDTALTGWAIIGIPHIHLVLHHPWRLHITIYFINVSRYCLIICWLKHKYYLNVCVENKMFLQNCACWIDDIHPPEIVHVFSSNCNKLSLWLLIYSWVSCGCWLCFLNVNYKLWKRLLLISGRFHAISHKNALSMDSTNWGPKSDHVISNYMLYRTME